MMTDFKKIENKWQKKWESNKIFEVKKDSKKPKFYCLEMFPYPSALGLHMGHAFNYTLGDVYARYKIMNGFNVLHPMGYDSLGLPAENAAIKEGIHPQKYTEESIKNFINQQRKLGLSYDWSKMVITSQPSYYKWDQWIFLKMLKKGLAYKKKSPVNWCPECKTVLANEQVHNGKCWRHTNTDVEVKHLNQWYFKITEYANELYEGIDKLKEWPKLIKTLQRNWIGKSHGAEIVFKINGKPWKIFTTRPDTLFGVTFMVISAQHPNLIDITTNKQKLNIEKFIKRLTSVSQEQIDQLDKEGVFTGSYAVHPLTGKKVPVWAGNFVLAEYGSGMVMAVPAHDQRDFEFAKRYDIEIKQVIQPKNKTELNQAFTEGGNLINSNNFNGLYSEQAKDEIVKELTKKKLGKKTINFRLRDWLISRQRYWGTPIPIINCEKCGPVPVSEKELPVELPKKVKFSEGNPLATNKEFVNTKCPNCKGDAKRETDTMDTFVNSSWYYLRYCDNKNNKEIFDKKKAGDWVPIDLYIGGKEHACMHLIYIRYYTKFLRDLGYLKIDEPAIKLFNQGMLHAEDGNKMSKSLGNVIDPLEQINKYGADSLRLFIVSIASPDSDFNWNSNGLEVVNKLFQKIHNHGVNLKFTKSFDRLQSKMNKSIKEITEDIKEMKYNLAIIKIRDLFETINKNEISQEDYFKFLKMFSVFCPHISEEIWSKQGGKGFISISDWPRADTKKINPKFDAMDKLSDQIFFDIKQVLKLAKLEKVTNIKLFVAEEWQRKLFNNVKKEINKDRDVGRIIKIAMIKGHEKESGNLIPKLIKDPTKLPEIILTQDEEIKVLGEEKDFLKNEFKAKEIEIIKAEDSEESKAKQTMPGKPAILIE